MREVYNTVVAYSLKWPPHKNCWDKSRYRRHKM